MRDQYWGDDKYRVVLASLVILLLAACVPGLRGGTPTPTVNLSLVDMSMITDQPCAAPCWYGLEPGRSTREQVLVTAKSLVFIDPGEMQEQPYYYKGQSQSWVTGTFIRLQCRRAGDGPCAGVLLYDGILREIYVFPPAVSPPY
jgi:hypothetical protein